MKIVTNKNFKETLDSYNLSHQLDFSVKLPKKIRSLIKSKIIDSTNGLTLKKLNTLHPPNDQFETLSEVEDCENHFHITDYTIDPKKCFMQGIYTTLLLADKFISNNYSNIKIVYFFKSPQQASAQSTSLGIEEDDFYTSDRISFHKIRKNESLYKEIENQKDGCILLIET